jgi:hypothetical protein
METCEQRILEGFEEESMCSAQGFPASRQVVPGSGRARGMTVGSGRQCLMWLEESSHLGLFSRILLGSSLWTSSEEYCYVWARLDTRFALSAFQLIPLGQSTDGSESSLWPTARRADGERNYQVSPNSARKGGNLTEELSRMLWPTPTNGDAKASGSRNTPESEAHAGISLTDAARQDGGTGRLWPTPTVPNGGRRNPEGTSLTGRKPDGGKAQMDLREYAIRMDDSPSGSPNPRFVEQLMGYEIDHTACAHSGTRLCRSRRTRSSRRSRG